MLSKPRFAILRVTDGTTAISLLPIGGKGFTVSDWRPLAGDLKAGGYWADSPIADGRRPVGGNLANTVETITFQAAADCADDLIAQLQDFRRLLVKAFDYWYGWGDAPVWIEAQSYGETNKRYALIYKGDIPDDGFPYGQPFVHRGGGVRMEDLALVFERGPWLETQPGTAGACVEISGQQAWSFPYYLTFNGTTSLVNCGSDVGLDDLPDAAFTAEAWVRADGRGEGSFGRIIGKYSWYFSFYDPTAGGDGLYAFVNCATAAGISMSGFTAFDADGLWHHVAMTWDDATYNYPRIWIDGQEPAYPVTGNRNGAIVTDAARDLVIGNDITNTRAWDGGIGWTRVSNSVRYAAAFTPPARCILPVIDANTVAQWISAGTGTAIDNQEGTAARDGVATDCTWACDCDTTFGRAETCADEVYIANKHNLAQLTHIFILDNPGVWSANLLTATPPYALLPAVPAGFDFVYFGIDTSIADSGPFSSLVFDLATAASGITFANDWRYWNGGWTALTVQDNTDTAGAMTGNPLDTTGVHSVHWVPPADWVPVALNGVTAYWISLEVQAVAGPVAPVQQHRQPYTICWPYVEIAADQAGGDIPALALVKVHNQSSDGYAGNVNLWTHRVVAGLRSVSRGSDFTPFINLADEQNNPNITVSVGGVACTFVDDVAAPTGRAINANWMGALPDTFTVEITGSLVTQYQGVFRAFLRLESDAGITASETTFITELGYTTVNRGGPFYVTTAQDHQVIDLGLLSFIPAFKMSDPISRIAIQFTVDNALNGDLNYYDLVLIPVDEWAVDSDIGTGAPFSPLSAYEPAGGLTGGGPVKLIIDSIEYPKQYLRTYSMTRTPQVWEQWHKIANGPAILQANSQQRLWFLILRNSIAPDTWYSEPEIAHSIQVFRQNRYKSLRGAR